MESDIVKIKRTVYHSILNAIEHVEGRRITSDKIRNLGIEQVYNGDFDIYAFKITDKKKWVLTRIKYGI